MDLCVTVKRRTAVEAAALATADACIGHVRRPSLEPGSAYGHPYAPSPPRAGSAAIQQRASAPTAGSGPSFRFARGSGRARAASFECTVDLYSSIDARQCRNDFRRHTAGGSPGLRRAASRELSARRACHRRPQGIGGARARHPWMIYEAREIYNLRENTVINISYEKMHVHHPQTFRGCASTSTCSLTTFTALRPRAQDRSLRL